MKNYIEITNINTFDLWSKLYTQLHLTLVEKKNAQNKVPFGFSFPEYFFNSEKQIGFIGSMLRIFGPDENPLRQLDLHKRLNNLSDYIQTSEIKTVPVQLKSYAIYQRQQVKSNAERLARRKAKRQNISYEKALEELKSFKDEELNFPFIQLQSSSTGGQKFRLFIERKLVEQPMLGDFSLYGLSSTSTVPEF